MADLGLPDDRRGLSSKYLRFAPWGQRLCLGAAAIGALGLTGWLAGVRSIVVVVPGQPPMMPNRALSVLLLGTAGALVRTRSSDLRRALALACATVVLVVASLTLAEYALHLDLGIDEVLVTTGVGPDPGRMSPPTAAALVFLALAIVFYHCRPRARFRPSEWLELSAALIAFTAALGQSFGAGALYRLDHDSVIGVAIPTAVAIMLASLGLLFQSPDAGLMRVLASRGPGGILLRRLAFAAALGPVLLGVFLSRLLDVLGVHEFALVYASLAVAATLVGLGLLTATALPLNRMYEALESARARTHALIEHALDGIVIADLDGRCTDVNSAACQLFGYAADELLGKSITALLPAEELERFEEHKKRLLEGKSEVGEWTLRRRDGSLLPVEVSAKVLPDGRWQAFVREITERKRSQEALRLSEAKFAGIVAISADAIVSIDERHRITVWNDGAEAMFGYSKDEAVGAPLDILIPERLRAAHRRHVERFAAGPAVGRRAGERSRHVIGLRKSGEEFPAEAAISKLEVDGKRILTVSMRDVTEQKRRESERELLAEVGAALGSSLDIETTLRRVAERVVRSMGDACIVEVIGEKHERLFTACVGRDPSTAAACEAFEKRAMHPELSPVLASELREKRAALLESVHADALETSATREERLGALCALSPRSVLAVPLVSKDERIGAIILVSSTPSRSFGLRELRLVEQIAERVSLWLANVWLYRTAQEAIKARDDVLGVVAHDLRNPLGAILLQASLLRRESARAPGLGRPADAIERAALRMRRLIQDLLDVTRLESGALTIDSEPQPSREILKESVESQRDEAASRAIELRVDLPRDLPDVSADRDRLLQVFDNLIGNALKFTPSGGRVIVGASPRGDDVLFWVADTGIGVADEDVPHLFERFWQANKEDRRRGAGLGLPIVKAIVEAHAGRIWVETTLGRGSTFFFTVPIAPAPAKPVELEHVPDGARWLG